MFREFPKRGSSPLLGFNSSNVWNDWNPGMERLEPTLVFNGLNGAQRLNDWNVLNKFFGNTVSDVPNVTRQKVAVASFFLEVAFRLEKSTAKLLNDAFYATFYCQIKMLSWSDPD
jgi:hypothetical protein